MLLVIAVVGAVVLARKVKRAELIEDPLVDAHEAEPSPRPPSDERRAEPEPDAEPAEADA